MRYKVNRHNQRCFRDSSNNVKCLYLDFKWDETSGELSGGKGELARIYCPAGFSHFIDKCIEISDNPSTSSYDGSLTACNTVDKTLFRSQGFIQFEALKNYFSSISLSESFWIGKWDVVGDNVYSAQVEWATDGKTVSGDCVMANKDDGFKWTRTDCTANAAYFCEARPPKCPPQYIWIPEAGLNSCYKFMPHVGHHDTDNNKMEQSISTVNKACMADGTSLAAPDTDTQLTALATWLQYSDRVIHGDYQDRGNTPRLFLGYRFFKQELTKIGICPSCDWPNYYYSPWKKEYDPVGPNSVPSKISALNPDENESCFLIQRNANGPPETIEKTECYISEPYDKDTFLGAVCEYRECKIDAEQTCIFPFKFAGRAYDKCTTAGFGNDQLPAWCSLSVDEDGHHVVGNEGLCPQDCAVSDCPMGFWSHLGTCIQESASTLDDAFATVAEGESKCMEQGGRLYQPRSTRSLKGLEVKTPQFYNKDDTDVKGILGWANDLHTSIGILSDNSDGDNKIFYKDGSSVPYGLTRDPEGLEWQVPFYPAIDGTCVMWKEKEKMANLDCEGYSVDGAPYLAYVCEAKPMTTTDKFKHCHFPFKETADGPLRHSCIYAIDDKKKPYGWCATSVDADGVMVSGEIGKCDDERNTVYSGPGERMS